MANNRPRKSLGGAPLGNKNRVALKDSNVRQIAYQSYCAWIAKGKSKSTWTFVHDEYRCCYKTFEKYLDDNVEFLPQHKYFAEAQGYAVWEEIVEESAKGINTKANTASLQMVMRNKFGWDKQEKMVEVDINYSQQFDKVMAQVKSSQEALSALKNANTSSMSEQKS